MVQYWVKGDRIHKYPVPSSCNAKRINESLYFTIADAKKHGGKDKCDNCFPELPR